jgi:hypothetical protein
MSSEALTKAPAATAAAGTTFHPWHYFALAGLVAATAAVLFARDATPQHIIFISLTIGAASLVGMAVYRVLWPLVASDFAESAEILGGRTRAALERDKTLVLRAIKELEFDRAMGKVSDTDYQEMSGRLRARAVGIIRQLDQGAGYRELIERELALRLDSEPAPAAKAVQAIRCGGCQTLNDLDAKFCKNCGRGLRS